MSRSKYFSVELSLTPDQVRSLMPLLLQAQDEYYAGNQGAIVCQPLPADGGWQMRCGFIPSEYAERLAAVMFEFVKKERRQAGWMN